MYAFFQIIFQYEVYNRYWSVVLVFIFLAFDFKMVSLLNEILISDPMLVKKRFKPSPVMSFGTESLLPFPSNILTDFQTSLLYL